MQVLGVFGREATGDAVTRTADRIVDRLSRDGRVGVVRYDATIADGTPTLSDPDRGEGGADDDAPVDGSAVTYALGADGDWVASGTGLSVTEALDRLATDCAAAVLVGVETTRFPSIVVAPEGAAGVPDEIDVVATVSGPENVDVDAVAAALERADPFETLSSLVAAVKRDPAAERAGAIATFTGRVRAKDDPDDARTEYLEFEKYEGVADERLAALRADLEAREGVHAVRLHHRTGVVRDGEDIVFVVVLAGHRAEAFRTVEDGIDRLKEEVPLFKKEVTVEDAYWVHDRS